MARYSLRKVSETGYKIAKEVIAEILADERGEACQRTFALYRPGVPLPGVSHRFAWSGSVPCTGRLRCTLCGAEPR
jgi:hypothetical protein